MLKEMEDLNKIKEQEESEFLKSIEDPFSRIFMTVQYSLSNDVNKTISDLLTIDTKSTDKSSPPSINSISSLKSEIANLSSDSNTDKIKTAEVLEAIGNLYETKEKIVNYWETAKSSESSNSKEITSRLGYNDLFTKEVQIVEERWNRIGQTALKFSEILKDVTIKSEVLNKEVNKKRTLKIKGGFDDPLLSKCDKSTILTKIEEENNRSSIEWRRNNKESRVLNENQNKINREIEKFMDELILNDGYLLQILDERIYNLFDTISMNENLSHIKPFKHAISNSKNHSEKSKHKFDFTEEVKCYDEKCNNLVQNATNKRMNASDRIKQGSLNYKENEYTKCGLIEIKNESYLHELFEKSIIKSGHGDMVKIKLPENKNIKIIGYESKPKEVKMPKNVRFHSVIVQSKDNQRVQKDKNSKLNSILKEKQKDANKINKMVQGFEATFEEENESEESSEESSEDSDELDDKLGEMRPNGKIPLRKLKTAIPETLNIKCNPSELLEGFFDDPLEHPLIAANAFQKSKSEMINPKMGLKSLLQNPSKKQSNKEITKISEKEIKNIKNESAIIAKADILTKDKALNQLKEQESATKKLIEKPVEKFASKTFYGVNPLEMARKLDQENSKNDNESAKTSSIMEKSKTEIKLDTKNSSDISIKDKEEIQPKETFKANSGSFTSPFSSKLNVDTKPKQYLSTAEFGKSSLFTENRVQQNLKENIFSAERKFGSSAHEGVPISGGFKEMLNSNKPSTTSFLTSKSNKQVDNDMADEDIWGEENTSSSAFRSSKIFGGPTITFNQPKVSQFGVNSSGGSLQSSLGFDPKSNPSFTQRRK